MHSPRSLRALSHSRSRSLSSPSKVAPNSNQYSTYLQTTTKPDYHSSTAASVTNGSPSSLATQTSLSSPLGKSSYVQQMWFHGGAHKNRVSKEELSESIAAMIEGDATAPEDARMLEANARISLLVGEIVQSTSCAEQTGMVHTIKLSNVCSPRTILSSNLKYTTSELKGRRVIVATNLPLRDTERSLSEGMLLCSQGELLHPGEDAKVGEKVTLAGKSPLLNHLEFDKTGIAEFINGTPAVDSRSAGQLQLRIH